MAARSVRFDPQAHRDAEGGRAWYARRSTLAARALLTELIASVEVVREALERWTLYLSGTRRYYFPKFPFSLIYRVSDDTVKYGGRTALVESADGVRGILCRSLEGSYFLRVSRGKGRFTDFDLLHSDLEVTIHDPDAAFYRVGKDRILDHVPETLGLKPVRTRRPKR